MITFLAWNDLTNIHLGEAVVKAVAGKEMVIEDICVRKKSGGKSGDWVRSPADGGSS